MTTEQKLKGLILQRYKSVRQFVQQTDMSYSTVDTILRRGLANSSLSNVLKLCNALEISADDLLEDRIVPRNLNRRSVENEIPELIKYTRRNMAKYTDFTIDGKPLTFAELEKLIDSVEFGIEIIRRDRARND